jgi:cytochrome c5
MKNKIFFLIIIIISLSIILSCSNGNSQEKETLNSISEQQNNTTNTQLQSTENLNKGKTLVEERCIDCHNIEKTYSGKYDKKGWEKVVKSMIDKGAKLNKDENVLVVKLPLL